MKYANNTIVIDLRTTGYRDPDCACKISTSDQHDKILTNKFPIFIKKGRLPVVVGEPATLSVLN